MLLEGVFPFEIARLIVALLLMASILAVAVFFLRYAFKFFERLIGASTRQVDPELIVDAFFRVAEGGDDRARDAALLVNLLAWSPAINVLAQACAAFGDRSRKGSLEHPLLESLCRDKKRLDIAARRVINEFLEDFGEDTSPLFSVIRARQRRMDVDAIWSDRAATIVLTGLPDPADQPEQHELAALWVHVGMALSHARGVSEELALVLHHGRSCADKIQAARPAARLTIALLRYDARAGGASVVDREAVLAELGERLGCLGLRRPKLTIRLLEAAADLAEARGDLNAAAERRLKATDEKAFFFRMRFGDGRPMPDLGRSDTLTWIAQTDTIAPQIRSKALFRLGNILSSDGDEAGATASFRRSLELDLAHRDPNDPIIAMRLATVGFQMMEKSRISALGALRMLERAWDIQQKKSDTAFEKALFIDHARLLAIALLLVGNDINESDRIERAHGFIDQNELDAAEIRERVAELRTGWPEEEAVKPTILSGDGRGGTPPTSGT